MNKVYKISDKIPQLIALVVILMGVSSCTTYQPGANVESDGVYYNPKTDKTIQQVSTESQSSGKISIGQPYFDANGNGAEEFFYEDDDTTSRQNVTVNNQDWRTTLYSDDYTVSNSATSWGRNDGVNINIYSSSPYYGYGWNTWPYGSRWNMSFGWGWNNYYGPSWGYPYYGGSWGWNNYYGPGWGYPHYGGAWGWNNYYGHYPYYNNGYYGYNRPRGYYTQPGMRPGGNINAGSRPGSIIATRPSNGIRPIDRTSQQISTTRPNGTIRPVDRNPQQTTNTRPGSGRDRPTGTIGTNNTATREVRPTRESQTARPTSPTREVRPTRDIQTVRPTTPTREVRPTQNITPTRPTRDVQTRPTREMQTRPAQSTQQTRPSYNTTPSRSSMGSGTMGGGSRGGSTGTSSGSRGGSGRR